MNQVATVEARHRAYSLIGRLVVEGLTEPVRPVVAALPVLNDGVGREDPDAWAVDHEVALSQELFPYESVFRSEQAQLGGPIAGGVRAAYERGGVTGSRLDVEPDHLGLELAHLAHLCAAERDARVDGHTSVDAIRQLQATFLEQHLLVWGPGVLAGMILGPSAFYARVARLAVQVLADHAAELGVGPASWTTPAEDPLADPNTRLRDLAEHLITPARSGWFLSRSAIARVAARADLPSGFGPRKKLLEGLLFASADHRRAPELLGALTELADAWGAVYAELEDEGLPCEAWIDRLDATRSLLDRMATAVTA